MMMVVVQGRYGVNKLLLEQAVLYAMTQKLKGYDVYYTIMDILCSVNIWCLKKCGSLEKRL